MSRNFDALKSPLQGFLGYHSRFVPPTRWITFTGVPSTLSNFPVLVKAVGWENIATGYDVHFQDSSGNELPFDLDWYDDSSKTGAWWVKIPTLYSGTAIKVLYGDVSITTDQSSPTTVWTDYEFVYHFNVSSTTQPAAKGSSSDFVNSLQSLNLVSGGATGRALKVTNNGGGSVYHGWTTPTTSGWRSYAITAIGTAGAGIECRAESGIYYDLSVGGNNPGSGVKFTTLPLTSGELACVNFSHTYSSSPVSKIAANGTIQSASYFAYVGALSSFAGTIYFATYEVDEIRLRKSTVSEDWQMYEYYNSILHNDYTTYSEEV